MQIEMIDMELIDIEAEGDRRIYFSLEDAIKNPLNLVPGPVEVADEIKMNNGVLAKPIKVKRNRELGRYTLVEGRVKFWGWMILYGIESKIPAVVVN